MNIELSIAGFAVRWVGRDSDKIFLSCPQD